MISYYKTDYYYIKLTGFYNSSCGTLDSVMHAPLACDPEHL